MIVADRVWTLDVVDDVGAPGWLFIPDFRDLSEQERWMSAVAEEVAGEGGWDGEPLTRVEIRDVLHAALIERDAADAIATFQVWPPLGGVAVMCHISLFPSDAMPDWAQIDTSIQRIEADYIGPGIQCVTRRIIPSDDGSDVEYVAAHFIFDDGTTTLMITLNEAYAPMIVRALPGAATLLQNLRLLSSTDGVIFKSAPIEGVLEEDLWLFEEKV
jgi:hypothetical protein